MGIVCHQEQGLFPLHGEINVSCSCPDWAVICKHVAAVLYGVASRLDHAPEQLFLLRGVNHEELVDISSTISKAVKKGKSKAKYIPDAALEDVFEIEIETKKNSLKTNLCAKQTDSEPSKLDIKPIKSKTKEKLKAIPFTGENIRKKRISLGLTQSALAKVLGVSASRISQWEKKEAKLFHSNKEIMEKWDKLNL